MCLRPENKDFNLILIIWYALSDLENVSDSSRNGLSTFPFFRSDGGGLESKNLFLFSYTPNLLEIHW